MNQDPSGNTTEGHHLRHIPTSKRNTLILLGSLLVLLMFWDSILGMLLHGLLYLLEYLELFVEETLELLFHLEGHMAQIWTAWIGFATFVALLAFGYIAVKKAFIKRFRSKEYFRLWLRRWAKEHWIWLAAFSILYLLIVIFL